MRELSKKEVAYISAGLSGQIALCFRGGVLGGTEGAVIGGILCFPLWGVAAGCGGNTLALVCVAMGIGAGSVLGGLLGACAGYTAYYWCEG